MQYIADNKIAPTEATIDRKESDVSAKKIWVL